MSIAVSLLLKEMRKKFPLKEGTLAISNETRKRIKKIQSICNKDYFNQSFYGSAALNRQIILDKRIADLLTPETILAILALHTETKNLNKKSPIAIWRNSSSYLSLAAVLFYSFNEGLETIEFMPNNESQYGNKQYQEQKRKFRENTNKIIEHIKKAATLLEITPEAKEFQQKTKRKKSLIELFQTIENTIDEIKNNHQENALLHVPTYTPDDIREQSIHGFTTICHLLDINYTIAAKNTLIIDNAISLDELIKQFLSSEETLLNGKVIHLFYDRVHLEACIEQHTKIIIQNNEYYLKDILREMVAQCETAFSTCNTAKEQFEIRLKLCNTHLKTQFPAEYKSNTKKIREDDLPQGYIHIKKMMLSLESEIDKSLWTCSFSKTTEEEYNFLHKITELYDKAEKKLPLKKCVLLAKWQYPNGYKKIRDKIGVNFFFNLLDEKIEQNPTQGPRFKNDATVALEQLIHALLNDYTAIKCEYNALGELELFIDNSFFNITQILLHDPDFEHIQITEKQLEKYALFAVKKARNKPTLISHKREIIPTPQNYKKLDKNGECAHLHYGEKLAITLYSSDFYNKIQHFLRYQGQTTNLQKASSNTLNHLVPEILLSAAIAAHGLAKPTLNPKQKTNTPILNYRKEITQKEDNFFKEKLASVKSKHSLFEKGFLSTSANNSFKQPNTNTYTVFQEDNSSNTLGKRVEVISQYRKEKEVLYGPGTQLRYTDYHKEGTNHFFAARPIRSIDDIKPNDYSSSMRAWHELEIIDKMFEIHLIKNKHSQLRRFFDTVSNDDKLKCVQKAKIAIKNVFEHLQSDKELSSEQLTICQQALETALKENKQLVSDALGPASLGATDAVLHNALLRVNHAINLITHSNNNKPQI